MYLVGSARDSSAALAATLPSECKPPFRGLPQVSPSYPWKPRKTLALAILPSRNTGKANTVPKFQPNDTAAALHSSSKVRETPTRINPDAYAVAVYTPQHTRNPQSEQGRLPVHAQVFHPLYYWSAQFRQSPRGARACRVNRKFTPIRPTPVGVYLNLNLNLPCRRTP